MTYLYHAKSNEFFIFTSQLAKRGDMQVVDAESLEDAKAKVDAIHNESESLAKSATPTKAAKGKAKAEPKEEEKPAEAEAEAEAEKPAATTADLFTQE